MYQASKTGFRIGSYTALAFLAFVLVGGSNPVAVKFSDLELPPFWGAATRFISAAAVFWLIVIIRRTSLPRGRALLGTLLYGALSIGASYAFIYWGILRIQAAVTMIVLSLGPLLTMLFAAVHRIEPLRGRGLAGALTALAGIGLAVGQEVGRSVPAASLIALILGAACIAEGSVLFKLFPKAEPTATNAIATSAGGAILLALSRIAGEPAIIPGTLPTWAAFAYLVLVGSVIFFFMYVSILTRWSASATSYAFLLFPIATTLIASWISHEGVTLRFILGGAVVLLGVWLGTLSRLPRPAPRLDLATPTVSSSLAPAPNATEVYQRGVTLGARGTRDKG
jgi:drug/metabolite transporter (DMT)-like permease